MAPARIALRLLRPSMSARPMSISTRMMVNASRAAEPGPGAGAALDLDVGELEGGSFKVEPLRRTGEDANTMRARLVYQSRKRGTLESDLLMSTFADAHLQNMTMAQMAQYDLFLDENDWDIYYWATQESTAMPQETVEGVGIGVNGVTGIVQRKEMGSAIVQNTDTEKQAGPVLETDHWRQGKARSGEWAQTIGTFKPAYRPVPARWMNSEILSMLRRHIKERSAGGIHQGSRTGNETISQSARGGGMAFMPPVRNMDA